MSLNLKFHHWKTMVVQEFLLHYFLNHLSCSKKLLNVIQQTRQPFSRWLFHTKVVIQNRNHWAMWDTYDFHNLGHKQFPVGHDHIVHSLNWFDCSDLNRSSRMFGFTHPCASQRNSVNLFFVTVETDGLESPDYL